MFAYPDDKVAGGYFLLLAGLPADIANAEDDPAIKREITLVIDRSGSMRNEKVEQVKEAALQIIAGLKQGEAFNVCIYNNTVEWFSRKPVPKNKENEDAARKYIEGITATGGTNIHEALRQALDQQPSVKPPKSPYATSSKNQTRTNVESSPSASASMSTHHCSTKSPPSHAQKPNMSCPKKTSKSKSAGYSRNLQAPSSQTSTCR